MPRGRPKGSKNKVKISVNPSNITADTPMAGVSTRSKFKRENLPVDSNYVLTTTIFGTPIALVSVGKCKNTYHFIVIPNYENKNYITTVSSLDVVKPVIDNPEIAKEFELIPFGTRVLKRSPKEPTIQPPDPEINVDKEGTDEVIPI